MIALSVNIGNRAIWSLADYVTGLDGHEKPIPDSIEINTPETGRVIMRGCADATMERDGKLLATTKEKDLACSRSRPIIVRNPGRDFSVETTEHSTLIEEQAIGEIKK